MSRHLFVDSKTTFTSKKVLRYPPEKILQHQSRKSRDNYKDSELDANNRQRRYSTNRIVETFKIHEQKEKYSKNQSTSDKHRQSSKLHPTIPDSSPITPHNTRSNLLNNPSSSRSKHTRHIPSSSTNLAIESRPPPLRIKILDLRAEIESKPTVIDESSSSVLKYKTPQFKSHVTFQMPTIDENQNWKIGWIQACTHMEFFNTYGDYGYTSWEFPEMVTREKPLINDSDGRNYPWYGSSHQVVTINGPISHSSKYTVTMRDFFHPWYVQI
ncbi:unnamed protein product [Adineta ricciae]|uniref:Uncharacterized protein n=1 Tax=Adineta ricciae TaxID=249248 RepID=A0A815YNV4_ADIRI|nr:unnamed protein product [Adineta ricciae]